jgi:hypothetical protein
MFGEYEPDRAKARRLLEGTPEQVRAALAEEEIQDFDAQWFAAMGDVADLLTCWRRIAILTVMLGPAGYREMLARAEHILLTGERTPGSFTLEQLRARTFE